MKRMRVKLIYFRRDGRRHLTAQYDSAQTSFAGVLAEVRANSHVQGKCAGVTGRADGYHIVVEVEKQRAVVHASARP